MLARARLERLLVLRRRPGRALPVRLRNAQRVGVWTRWRAGRTLAADRTLARAHVVGLARVAARACRIRWPTRRSLAAAFASCRWPTRREVRWLQLWQRLLVLDARACAAVERHRGSRAPAARASRQPAPPATDALQKAPSWHRVWQESGSDKRSTKCTVTLRGTQSRT
eukprot:scaffold36440_cov41-Phaeocystis_antarctica.AAC.1